jgi:hypothetical protein
MSLHERRKWSVSQRRSGSDAGELIRKSNPFFLASAACMLLGCYLVAGAASGAEWSARMSRVLILLGTLNLYEMLVVGLACYLIRRRGQLRDGLMLLMIEVLLLVDSTNLLNEAYQLNFRIGVWVNFGALVLAACKAGVVVHALKLRYSPRELAAAGLGYVGMLAVPGVLAAFNRTGVETMHMPIHGAWWILGMLPVAVAVILPRAKREFTRLEKVLGAAALAGPLASMLIRALAFSFVHDATFQFANLSPVLIGAAGALLWRGAGRIELKGLHTALTAAGVLGIILAAFGGTDLEAAVPGAGGLMYSPLRSTLLALALLYLWAALMGVGLRYAPASAGCMLSSCSGHTIGAMFENWGEALGKVVPETKTGWGVLALVGAFLFLAAGGAVSLLRKRPADETASEGAEG